MSGSDMHSRTVAGLMAYCDWLKEKGYQGTAAAESWKSATKMVFETVEPEDWGSISLEGLDLDDYMRRFQTLAGSKLRAETVATYKRRIANAMDAHAYYLENGKPPSFKRGTARKVAEGEQPAPAAKTKKGGESKGSESKVAKLPSPDFFEFNYPLSPGRVVRMELPFAMSRREIERLCTVLQTLEEQPQLPPGEAQAA